MPAKCFEINSKWKASSEEKINVIEAGDVFNYKEKCLVAGCEDGVVRIYDIPDSCGKFSQVRSLKIRTSLETKGGPIQQLKLHDVTRFSSIDVVSADSRGVVTVFNKEQILRREAIAEDCIQCMQIEHDALGNIAIVCSDSAGHICAFNPYSQLWRIRLSDMHLLKGVSTLPQVNCLLAVNLSNSHGHQTNYIIASDNCQHVYILHQGAVVMDTKMPTNITSMTSGFFIRGSDLEGGQASLSTHTQVALGGEQGAIYILSHFQVFLEAFANINQPLTQLKTLRSRDGQTDSLLCAGQFNALLVIDGGKEVARHHTSSWITSMTTHDISGDGTVTTIIATRDNNVEALKITSPKDSKASPPGKGIVM